MWRGRPRPRALDVGAECPASSSEGETPSGQPAGRLRYENRYSGILLLQLRIQFRGSLKFLLRLPRLTLPSQRLSQVEMRRRVGRRQIDRSPKL